MVFLQRVVYPLLACGALWLATTHRAVAAPAPPRVLVLYSNDRLLPANVRVDQGMRQALLPDGEMSRVALFGEFLDAIRFPDVEHRAMMSDYLRNRYREHPPQVLVAIGPQAFSFFLEHRTDLFPGVPLVFGGVGVDELDPAARSLGVAGLPMDLSVLPTVEALLAMRPQTRELVLVTGAAEFDRAWDATARRQCAPLLDRVRLSAFPGLAIAELKEKLAALPPDAAVLYLSFFQSPSGETTVPVQVAREIASVSAVPIVAPYETYLGSGVLGGCVTPFELEGFGVGQVVRRILSGETPESIGILPPNRPRYVFDHRQVERWGLDSRPLPAEAELRFRQPTLWEEHRGPVTAGVSVVAIQALLIVALLVARARRRRAERELRQSEERFASVFRGCPAAISIVRQSDGRLIDVNPAWEQFFEVSHAEALAHGPSEPGLPAGPETDERFRHFLKSGKSLRHFEQAVRTRQGTTRWRRVSCELVPLGGEPCFVVMSENITEQREVEEARRSLAHTMRLATLGELTASIAHEVNQPLGAILSNADAAEMLLDSDAPPLAEVRQILADIRRDDLRASDVIQRVRSLVGRREVQRVPLDLNEVVDGVLRLVAHDAQRRGVAIVRDLAPGLPPVCGDRVQLEQIMLNLLLNAMDAMKDTPVATRQIALATMHPGAGTVLVRIRDSGHGIAPDRLPRIFDSFFTTKEDGMGLGLALARSIAESHGGRITAENNPAGGATFSLLIPAIEHPPLP